MTKIPTPRITFATLLLSISFCVHAVDEINTSKPIQTLVHTSPLRLEQPLYSDILKEQKSYITTLKDLVLIESGSGDREGLDKLSLLISKRLKALGGQVEFIEPAPNARQIFDGPAKPGRMVKAQFNGIGTQKILLIAHMDTVYQKGMLKKQPFKIDGDRIYGLGIQDDKQGIASIIHILNILRNQQFKEYGKITVLINADEEVGSPTSSALITQLGAEHDATFSYEASLYNSDLISLTTSGVGVVNLAISGRASHAGFAPELGLNALDELAFQIQQMRDLSDPIEGIKMNWTLANAGSARNVIPSFASASADVRVVKVESFDVLEGKIKDRTKTQQTPEAVVDINLLRGRPPLEMSSENLTMAEYAENVYSELGRKLVLNKLAVGAGTDAAFAALNTKGPVLESMGLQGFGAHSDNEEFVLMSSIAPRLYLGTRLIMDLSKNKIKLGN